MKESSKNILIIILFLIFIFLIYLLYYSYNYQKSLLVEPVKNEVVNSKNKSITLNGVDLELEFKENLSSLDIYLNNKKINTISNSNINDSIEFKKLNYLDKEYLLIVTKDINSSFIIDSSSIIYEFKNNLKFIDDLNNNSYYIEDNKLYVYKSLLDEDLATYSSEEYARKYLVNITDEGLVEEFISFEHGSNAN